MSLLSTYQDQELLQLMSGDDAGAFEEIWSRYWETTYNSAYKRLKDVESCRDAVQDVFIDLWVRRSTLSIANLPAYLNSAIRYKVYKIASKSKTSSPFFDVFESMASTAVGADNIVLEKELLALAESWLDNLPEKRKEIFLLYYRERLSTKEIAERLGISQKTVQNQLGLATKSLHKNILPLIILALQVKLPAS